MMISLQKVVPFVLLASIASSSITDGNTKLSRRSTLQKRAGRWGGPDEEHGGDSSTVENGIRITKANVVNDVHDDGLTITKDMEMQTSYHVEPIMVMSQKPLDFGQNFEESYIFNPHATEDVNVYVIVGKDFPWETRVAWKLGVGKTYINTRFNRYLSSDHPPDQVEAIRSQTNGVAQRVAFFLGSSFFPLGTAQNDRHLMLMSTAADAARAKGGKMVVISEPNSAGHIIDPAQLLINHLDSRSTKTTSSGTERLVRPVLLKSSAVSKRGSPPRPAQIATLIDVSNPATISKRTASSTTIQELNAGRNGSPQQASSSSTSATAQFNEILSAYQSVQANISNAIFPILVEMTSKTNSSLIFEAARSIWIDLASPNQAAVGPFSQGYHCLDDLMNDGAKQLNLTVSDKAFQPYVAIGAILLDVYADAWNRAYTAVNQSGLLNQLHTLGSKLLINSNETIAPASFFLPSNDTYDDSFFTDYNRNKDLDKLLL